MHTNPSVIKGCPAVVVPQCAEHVVVVLQKKENLNQCEHIVFHRSPHVCKHLATLSVAIANQDSLSRVRSLQMGKIFKGKPKRAPATAVTVHVLCL